MKYNVLATILLSCLMAYSQDIILDKNLFDQVSSGIEITSCQIDHIDISSRRSNSFESIY